MNVYLSDLVSGEIGQIMTLCKQLRDYVFLRARLGWIIIMIQIPSYSALNNLNKQCVPVYFVYPYLSTLLSTNSIIYQNPTHSPPPPFPPTLGAGSR